eukprot:gb/GECG01012246.1/.p1 GENE.gb/GECG01012246.1/~~gb/GECG01012246.1/.p1  ORF type:complete len:781 (+),score=79.80 gb/GECG01012246.1/:1-2343(+)
MFNCAISLPSLRMRAIHGRGANAERFQQHRIFLSFLAQKDGKESMEDWANFEDIHPVIYIAWCNELFQLICGVLRTHRRHDRMTQQAEHSTVPYGCDSGLFKVWNVSQNEAYRVESLESRLVPYTRISLVFIAPVANTLELAVSAGVSNKPSAASVIPDLVRSVVLMLIRNAFQLVFSIQEILSNCQTSLNSYWPNGGDRGSHGFLFGIWKAWIGRICRKKLSPGRIPYSPTTLKKVLVLLCLAATTVLSVSPAEASVLQASSNDLRDNVQNGTEPCFEYFPTENLFRMKCPILNWNDNGYDGNAYISLHANEVFDGKGNIIELNGNVEDFHGLFKIVDDDIQSFDAVPLITNVHVKNGKTAKGGGFIVQAEQRYFIVDSCSSTGNITNNLAGGICGEKAGKDGGYVKILKSYSTGRIKGSKGGGIAGARVGYIGGTVKITQCYSTGTIEAPSAGGICADSASRENGHVYISESYSTGDINGDFSGGIVGEGAAVQNGEVNITDSYTRGDINGKKAGGITGTNTGGWNDDATGNVFITNTYASGAVIPSSVPSAGGLIGTIDDSARGVVEVLYSVYHGDNAVDKNIVDSNNAENNVLCTRGNSGNLSDIRGQLYHYAGTQRWHNKIWAVNGSDSLPILRFQLMHHSSNLEPSPSPSPAVSSSRISSPSTSTPSTPTDTQKLTPTVVPSQSPGVSATKRTSELESSPSPITSISSSRSSSPSTSTSNTPTDTPRLTPAVAPSQPPAVSATKRTLPVQLSRKSIKQVVKRKPNTSKRGYRMR